MKTVTSYRSCVDLFHDIQQLSDVAQRELLENGEPGERIRAAWALGVENPESLGALIRDATASEPNAGVRRHFVVILAGAGEYDIVASMARHDVDDRVRATAARYVASLLPGHPPLLHVARELLAGPDASVHAALFGGLHRDDVHAFRDALEASLTSDSSALREVAICRLAELEGGDVHELLLQRWCADDSAHVRRQALYRAWERLGLEALLEMVPSSLRIDALRDLRATRASGIPVPLGNRQQARTGELVEYGHFDPVTPIRSGPSPD